MNISSLFSTEKLRLWLLVIFVGLASLASYWVLEIIRSHEGQASSEVRTRMDYYVDNFNFVKMLPNGQNKYRLVGTKLIHYPNDDHAEVTLPVITNLDPESSPMTARSERAVVKNIANTNENEIHLYDKVVVTRPKTPKYDFIQLKTDYLLAFPDKNIMQTDLPIEITAGDTVTNGVGLFANNDTQQMQIFNNVSSFIPPRKEHLHP